MLDTVLIWKKISTWTRCRFALIYTSLCIWPYCLLPFSELLLQTITLRWMNPPPRYQNQLVLGMNASDRTLAIRWNRYARKRKADDEVEAVECCPTPVKRRFESQFSADELEIEDDTLPCWCTKWVSLKTDLTKSLEVRCNVLWCFIYILIDIDLPQHWQRHILTCQHFKRKDTTYVNWQSLIIVVR